MYKFVRETNEKPIENRNEYRIICCNIEVPK